ncbi:MAG: Gfo/Idh/MocA family oxidoreductase [Firmicutes bacterium]|nr:Gfo/Idh/MocA family oxidoreductase [Bacillota bacterium]
MAKDRLRVALIGHRFMGKVHSHAYQMVNQLMQPPLEIELGVLCGRDASDVAAHAQAWGWREWSTDWPAVVARPDIDAVDIATPSDMHPAIAIEALRHGKHVFCEKPLANSVKAAEAMVQAARQARTVAMVGFNYRRAPALQLAHQLIESGEIGRVFEVRGLYLQDWAVDPNVPLTWRFREEVAGSGALGDLLTHVIDLTHFLVGDFQDVLALRQTFIDERPMLAKAAGEGLGHVGAGREQKGSVTVDDVTAVLAHLRNGAVGVFEATRFATGHKNGLQLEIHGERGSLRFNQERMNELEFYSVEDRAGLSRAGFRRILATHPDHPYVAFWWPEGHILGYDVTFAHELYDWVNAIAQGTVAHPDFEDGVRCQKVVEAIVASCQQSQAVTVPSQDGSRD